MKKLCVVLTGCAVALSLIVLSNDQAQAIPAFKTEFDNMYVKKDSTDPKEKTFAEACEQAKCNICHVGKNKKEKNDYGKALDELLDKKADAKNPDKIKEALKTVEGQHSKPGDDTSPTFGDLLKEGKLP
jgi:uncharacterized lipoprotein NlpE involved in copper resistance